MAESWCNFVKISIIFTICINYCIQWLFNTYLRGGKVQRFYKKLNAYFTQWRGNIKVRSSYVGELSQSHI